MTEPTSIFDPLGPESRNELAEDFEEQLVAMGRELGWIEVCRNVDVIVKQGQPGRGIDVLWAVDNPWLGKVDGWVGEAKRRKDKTKYTPGEVQKEIQKLRDKIAGSRDSQRFYAEPIVRRAKIKRLIGGLIAYRSDDFDAGKLQTNLRDMDFERREEDAQPTRIGFLDPMTLEGIADCFNELGRPRQFLWFPSALHKTHWTKACPPHQLALGLIGYRTDEEKSRKVLWSRSGLEERDIEGWRDLVFGWGENFDVVAFTDLTEDARKRVAGNWQKAAEETEKHPQGRLPFQLVALNSRVGMKEFDRAWPVAD